MTEASRKSVDISLWQARRFCNLIRNRPAEEAIDLLTFSVSKVAKEIRFLLLSAVNNAEQNDNLNAEDLIVSKSNADKGPTTRRFRAKARGRSGSFDNETVHLSIKLQERNVS